MTGDVTYVSIANLTIDIQLANLLNMDEIPMYFVMAHDTTYTPIDSKDVVIKTTEHGKMRFTVVLTVAAGGKKLKPMIILKNLVNIPQFKPGEAWPEVTAFFNFSSTYSLVNISSAILSL